MHVYTTVIARAILIIYNDISLLACASVVLVHVKRKHNLAICWKTSHKRMNEDSKQCKGKTKK